MASFKKIRDDESEKTFFILKGVRVSYPHLFKKAKFEGKEQERGYGITAILDPDDHEDAIEALNKEIDRLVKSELKAKKIPSDKKCLRDGDDTGKDEYEGMMIFKAGESVRPTVMKKGSLSPCSEEDNPVYAGCYANIKVSLWAQNNQYGKRINANLVAVQFEADGEPFGNTMTEAQRTDGFDGETLDEDDDFAIDD